MKKQIKFLGVLAVALTLGLAACNGGGGDDKSQSGGKDSTSKHVHQAAEDAPWQSDDSKHWKDCSANDGGKVDNKSHTFGDPYDVVAATCEAAGSQKVKCTVCQKEVVQSIDALGHDWVDDETGGTPATCTTAGSKNQHCSRCDETQAGVEIPALGHDFGAWEDVEGKAATCTKEGEQQRKCSRCDEVETQTVAALGHDMQLIGDDSEPEAGKAKVRVYTCANECGQTYLGFKASEVSEASKATLNIGADGGAAFWGRPIGNALALDANGTSVNQQNEEVVYCSTETGDFFEYVFNLTAEQVATLGDKTLLYCDAKPADYLNGADFFAYSANNDDWTPGHYIDGGEGHYEVDGEGNPVMVKDHARATEAGQPGEELETEVKMGKRIEDYRYILYVDDQVKAFDDSIKNPTHGSNANMTREEFILPYVFNLHEGENKISLRMAGGYRSTFYNFTFRPAEEEEENPEPVNPWVEDTTTVMPTPAADGAIVKRYIKEGKDDVKYEIDVKTANLTLAEGSTWKTNPSTGAFKLNADGNSASFKFALPKPFEGTMYQTAYMDSYSNNLNKKLYYETNNVANIEVKVNGGSPIDLSAFATTTFKDVLGETVVGSNSETKDVEIGDVVLLNDNTISYARVKTLNLIVSKFVFIGKDHVEKYDVVSTLLNSDNKPVTLSEEKVLGTKAIEIKFSDFSTAPVNPSGQNPWYMAKGSFAEWKISVDKAITGARIYFSLECSSNDHLNRHLFNEAIWDAENGTNYSNDDKKAGTPDKSTEDAWRYSVAVGGTNFTLKNESRMNECGVTAINTQTYVYFTDIDLAAGENVLKLTQNNIGYRMKFNQNVRIIFEGDAVITGTAA